MSRAKVFFFFLTLFCGGLGCGGGGNGGGTAFTVDPSGPTVVQKGQNLQFITVPAGLAVLWSVEGGAPNGTIGASSGLYAPPSTLPVDPRVTVTATLGAFSASAQVDLRTGTSVSFGPEVPINDTKALGGFITGVHDLLAVRNGSLHADAAWMSGDAVGIDILFSQALDLAPFAPERNLTHDLTITHRLISLNTSPELNPALLIQISPEPNLQFLGSPDQGPTFSPPVPISPTGNSQDFAELHYDAQGGIHVSYVEGFVQVRYVRSQDGGQHWSDPPALLTDDSQGRCGTSLAVTPDGQTIHLCYADGPCGSGTDSTEGDIVIATSHDGGTTFPTKATVPETSILANCRIALGQGGEIYVSYKKAEEIFLTKSTDGGASFPAGHKVNTTPVGDFFPYPYMAVDSLGRIDMAWGADLDDNDTTESLRYARSTDGGASFSQDVELASAGPQGNLRVTGLVHDDSGRVHLAYITNGNDPDLVTPPDENDLFYRIAE